MSAQIKETPTAVAVGTAPSLVGRLAGRFNVEPSRLLSTLKATAFRQRPDRDGVVREPTNEEMMALLVVADEYHLNPFTKELFAFLDPKSGAIVAVVSVDGWIRIINERPELRSLGFVYSPATVEHKGKTCHEWIECSIKRGDRDDPVVIREYFAEVVRSVNYATPWDSHPNRMHRHKTLIQCARVAFGFAGIHDEDEASRIIEGQSARVPEEAPAVASLNAQIAAGRATAGSVLPALEGESRRVAADPVLAPAEANGAGLSVAEIGHAIQVARTVDELAVARDLIRQAPEAFRDSLDADAAAKLATLGEGAA